MSLNRLKNRVVTRPHRQTEDLDREGPSFTSSSTTLLGVVSPTSSGRTEPWLRAQGPTWEPKGKAPSRVDLGITAGTSSILLGPTLLSGSPTNGVPRRRTKDHLPSPSVTHTGRGHRSVLSNTSTGLWTPRIKDPPGSVGPTVERGP